MRIMERLVEQEGQLYGVHIKDIVRSDGNKLNYLWKIAIEINKKVVDKCNQYFDPYVRTRSIQLFEAGQYNVGISKDVVREHDLQWTGSMFGPRHGILVLAHTAAPQLTAEPNGAAERARRSSHCQFQAALLPRPTS